MLFAKIKLEIKNNVISEVADSKGINIKVLRCMPREEGGGSGLLRIDTDPLLSSETIIGWFTEKRPDFDMSCVTISPGRHMMTFSNSSCNACNTFSNTDCFLESGCSMDNGSVVWSIIAPNNEQLRIFIEKLRSQGIKLVLISVKRLGSRVELTKKQDVIMRMAYSLGYFEIPKKVTLDQMAIRAQISKSTLDLILRRAQKKLIADYVGSI